MKTEDLFARKCSITGEGIDEGWIDEDCLKYFKNQTDVCNYIKGLLEKDTALMFALNVNLETVTQDRLTEIGYWHLNIYWTTWEVDVVEEQAYTLDGKLYNYVNGKWVEEFNINDYELVSTDGVTTEVWEHNTTSQLVTIPIEIVRDFENIEYN